MKEAKAILNIIKKNKSFLIASHHNPDADALGSCLSMALFLKALGKMVTVANEDAVPQWLTFLPQSSLIKKASLIKKRYYDVAFILDCGDRARIGGVESLLIEGKPSVNIDHHITNDRFGSLNCVVPKASSTCEILFELFKISKCKLNKAMAVLLYAGMMTDTGSFRYENTSARVHAIASELMAFGINAQDMYQRLYVGIPVKDMKGFTKVIHEAQLLLNNRLYCVILTQQAIKAFSTSFDLKEKLFGFLRSVEGIEVVLILTEISDKETRINLRSQGDFNVAKLAAQFNGGGHVKAAGGKVYGNLVIAQKQLVAAISKEMKG